ncbi:MAG: glycosyltransferase family 2 protein [Candidatus Micrarchaeaceae archaeon]
MSDFDDQVFLSVIVPTYNRKDLLFKCLTSVYENLSEMPFVSEVIVVDDNSQDGTSEMIKKFFPNVITIKHSEEKFPCISQADGQDVSKGRLIIRIDDDNVMKENCIRNLVEFMIHNKDVAFCGAISFNEDGKLSTNIGSTYSKILKIRKLPRYRFKEKNIPNPYEVDLVDNTYIYRKDLIDLSLFRKMCKFFPWSLEDAYIQTKLKEQNYKIMINPSAVTVHYQHRSSINKKQIYHYMRSRILWLKIVQGTGASRLPLLSYFFIFATIATTLIKEHDVLKWPDLIRIILRGAKDAINFNVDEVFQGKSNLQSRL